MQPGVFQQVGAVQLGWEIVAVFILMAVLFILAVRVWAVLGIASILLLKLTDVLPMSLFGESLFSGLDAFALIAVPLFILTGDVLVRTGLSQKLLDLAEETLGTMNSGLGTSTIFGCGLFACISGSDAADAAAVGRVTYSRLVEKGYPEPYACAMIAAGACTGVLIPPSISYIIIGLILGISAATLFLACVVPGILILLSVMVTNILLNRYYHYESSRGKFSFRRWLRAVYEAKWALLIPVIILGGIYSGVFTPTESAASAVAASIIIGFAQRRLHLSDFPRMMESSAKVCGVVMPILAMSLPFAQTLGVLQIPQYFVYSMTSLVHNSTLIMFVMLLILMIAGMIMESAPNIIILSPILLPLALAIGMDEIHFCIFMVTALGIGFITPPLGINLFVMSGLTGTPVHAIASRAVPFMVAMLVMELIIMLVPQISLWLM